MQKELILSWGIHTRLTEMPAVFNAVNRLNEDLKGNLIASHIITPDGVSFFLEGQTIPFDIRQKCADFLSKEILSGRP